MIWIPEYLSKNKSETSDDQTLYVDLPEKEQISFLKVEIRITTGDTVNNLRSILDPIEKFEVIADGVKTIYNLEPEIASYIHFVTQNGQVPPHQFYGGPDTVNRLEFVIPFGRYLYDEEYMLDTGLYDSVQLRIPYTLNTTYEKTESFQHTIVMYRPLEKLAPVGFIRNRTIQKETSSGAEETIIHKLPMTYPWRYLGVRVEDIDQHLTVDLTDVKLNIDEGRLILLDLKSKELLYADRFRYSNPRAYVNQPYVQGSETVQTFGNWAYPKGAIVEYGSHTIIVRLLIGEQCNVQLFDPMTGSLTTQTRPVILNMPSSNPHKCLTLYDGRKEPFPAASYTQGKLEYSMSDDVTILQTFVQEVVLGTLS